MPKLTAIAQILLTRLLVPAMVALPLAFVSPLGHAQELDSSVAACLKAWGKHPFGKNPNYRTIGTTVKVFGIGRNPSDTEVTSTPSLVLINPGVNVMGGTVYELLNPNGWYCLKTTVNVMGGMVIQAHCKAHIASSSGDTTVLGNNNTNKGVTVMGSTQIETVGCD